MPVTPISPVTTQIPPEPLSSGEGTPPPSLPAPSVQPVPEDPSQKQVDPQPSGQGVGAGAGGAAAGWLEFYNDRMQRILSAQSQELRKHFEDEIKAIMPTLQALGISPDGNSPVSGPGGATGPSASGPGVSDPSVSGPGPSVSGLSLPEGFLSGAKISDPGVSDPGAKPVLSGTPTGLVLSGPGGTTVLSSGSGPGASGPGVIEDTPGVGGSGMGLGLQQKSPVASSGSGAGANGFSTTRPSGELSKADSDKMAVQVAKALMKDFGLTKEQAAGVVGNLYWESSNPKKPDATGMNPHINEVAFSPEAQIYGAPVNNDKGYGWAQWTGSRKPDFINFAKSIGLDVGSAAANYAFLAHELRNGHGGTIAALKGTHSVADAVLSFRRTYEVPNAPQDEKRLSAGQRVLSLLESSST